MTTDTHTGKGYEAGTAGSNNLAMGMEHPNKLPTFEDPLLKRRWMLEHLAGAFRIFGRMGYSFGSAGHISIKDPVEPGTFWINPLNRHFSLIRVSDLVHVDMDCNILDDGNKAAVNAAGFSIHAAIHKARPDIASACHAHSVYGRAYSAFGKPLDMINQDVCIFHNRHSVFTNFGGIAFDAREGEEIAESIGEKGVACILQNHGLITVGGTVDEAAILFVYLEQCCQAQLLADAVTDPKKRPQIIAPETANYTLESSGDAESLYAEFQPDYEYELELTGGAFLK